MATPHGNITIGTNSNGVMMQSGGANGGGGAESANQDEEALIMGGLIDVRPKKLHMMQSLETRKSYGSKAKDNG